MDDFSSSPLSNQPVGFHFQNVEPCELSLSSRRPAANCSHLLLLLLFLCRPGRGQPLRRFPVSSAGFLAVRSSLALQQSIPAEPDSTQVLGAASLPEPTGKNSARLLAAARSDSHALILRHRLPRHPFSSLTFCYHLGVRPRGTVERLQHSPPSARFTPASCSRDGNLRLHKG